MQNYNAKHRYLAGRYKINFFDKCQTQGLPHSDRCYQLHGKTSRTVAIVNDDSGLLDLHLHNNLASVFSRPNKRVKLGWIAEPRGLNPKMHSIYNDLETNTNYWFNENGFDYIFTHDQQLLDRDDRFLFLLGNGFQVKRPNIYPKTRMTSMIASNKNYAPGHQLRQEIIHRLDDSSQSVDIYGNGWNYIRLKEQGLIDYRFSIAIENVCADTWITEKVLDCFATGTIPLYWGTEGICEHFNPDGIIFIDENFDPNTLTVEDYESRFTAVVDNYLRVLKLEHPLDFMLDRFLPDSEVLLKARSASR